MPTWTMFDDSPHVVQTRTPDGRDLVFMTGTAGFSLKAPGQAWLQETFYHLIGPAWRRIDSVAPAAALASIYNQHDQPVVAPGWAVDKCDWEVWRSRILLVVAVGVSGIDGYVYRFSYQATGLGLI
jgi:hypothetical protein